MKLWAEGKSKAYIYTRYGNPTLAVVEKKIAAMEGAEAAVVTASGMAAISGALIGTLQQGDELISTAQTYGGTYRLMRDMFPGMGIKVHHVGVDLAGIEQLVTPQTKVLYVETPTNPTVRLVDLQKAIAFAKKHKLISIIDNTFATPVLQNPIKLGFDIVVHSATKGLAGHSDVIAGAAAGSAERMHRMQEMVIHFGGSMDPEAAFLLNRGIKTVALAREAAVRKRDGGGEISGVASKGGAGALSGIEVASGSCAGEAADARVWDDAGVRYEGRIGGGAASVRPGAIVSAGGEPGRRGVAGNFAGVYVALQHVGGGADEVGDYGGDDTRVDRRGRTGRSDCGFAAGFGVSCTLAGISIL